MPVVCKVKGTGQTFQASMEWEPGGILGRDVHEIIGSKSYAGHLFDGTLVPETEAMLRLYPTKIEWAVLKAEDLEPLPAPYLVRIYPVRQDK
jgi:hypothetical protein